MTDAQALRCERIAADLAELSPDERAHVARSLASRFGAGHATITIVDAPVEVVEAAALPNRPDRLTADGKAWYRAEAQAGKLGEVHGYFSLWTAAEAT